LRVHAIVEDLVGARQAVAAGATVVQLRWKGPTNELIARGRGFRLLPVTFIVNDDLEAACELRADGVHLGQTDLGAELARSRGLLLGRSASSFDEAMDAEADYLGVGPIWPTPSKNDAGDPIGLGELRRICSAIKVPVVAIGGIDASNAALCIEAGAFGVAAIRAARDPALRTAVDAALDQREDV
jgi:thiamine-phosphate pyrophosphorylase